MLASLDSFTDSIDTVCGHIGSTTYSIPEYVLLSFDLDSSIQKIGYRYIRSDTETVELSGLDGYVKATTSC